MSAYFPNILALLFACPCIMYVCMCIRAQHTKNRPCIIDISIEHPNRIILSTSRPLCDHGIMYQSGLKDRLQKWPQMAQNPPKKGCFQYLIFNWLNEGHKYDLDGQIIDML